MKPTFLLILIFSAPLVTTLFSGGEAAEEFVPAEVGPEYVTVAVDGRRRLTPFQLCLICKCCAGPTCISMPCCFGIDCHLPNKPFGVCAFVPKTCNCMSCHA